MRSAVAGVVGVTLGVGLGRWVSLRSDYLRGNYDIDSTDAEILAYSERGFSSSGIAKRADLVEETVRRHLDRLEDEHGLAAVLACRTDQFGIESELGRR